MKNKQNKQNDKKKVAVLLSGGVDSSLALARLREEYSDVTAFYLKIWLEDEAAFMGDCPWEEDIKYARQVCELLDVPLETVPLQQAYYQRVVEYTVQELRAGRTPSPDIFCNQRIKFGAFQEAISEEYDLIGSGHYARLIHGPELSKLQMAVDPVKDQTYFLSRMYQKQLRRALFPIGHLPKEEVRKEAHRLGLPTKDRKDSQGICFLGKIKFRDFARMYLGELPGEIRETGSEKKLGMHKGYWFYTIGQRQGLGLSGGPWYVVRKDLGRNIIYVSHSFEREEQARNTFSVTDFHWINAAPGKKRLSSKLRHGPERIGCLLESSTGLERNSIAQVRLDEADPGIAPGQFAVFYDEDICLGSARIC